MSYTLNGKVHIYYLTSEQLKEARKGSKCSLEDKPKRQKQDFSWSMSERRGGVKV